MKNVISFLNLLKECGLRRVIGRGKEVERFLCRLIPLSRFYFFVFGRIIEIEFCSF